MQFRSRLQPKYQTALILLALYLLTAGIRLVSVKNYQFPFWFDQGRDAIVSRNIIEKHDLKIQGPTAAGTNDSVYHGVGYYYVIGPLYTLFRGDPQLVINTLILLTSLSVIAIYVLAFDITQNRAFSLLAGILYATSLDAIRAGTWLSNPVLAAAALPFLWYFIWLTFFRYKTIYLPLLAVTLAIVHQGAILFFPLWGVVLVSWYIAWQKNAFKNRLTIQQVICSAALYLAGISSMILAQVLAWRAGIFSMSTLLQAATSPESGATALWLTVQNYIVKLVALGTPSFPVLSVLIIGSAIFTIATQKKPQRIFFLLLIGSPLFLLSWYFKNMYHIFFGLEAIMPILIAYVLHSLPPQLSFKKTIIAGIVGILVLSNVIAWQKQTQQKISDYFVPQGTYLQQQLTIIDEIYAAADGKPFSISSLTNPYGYNTLWAYLFSWYGQTKYGYTPKWFGPDQTGLFGDELLPKTTQPLPMHISIYEPPEGIPSWLFTEFSATQTTVAGTPSAKVHSGSMFAEIRLGSLQKN